MRKCLFFALCLAVQATVTSNTNAEPLFQTQTATQQPTKEVTLQEFFKNFIDLRQKAGDQTWVVTCMPKEKDPFEVKYSGSEQNKAVEAAVLKLEKGDKIVISSDAKPAKHIITYVLKQQQTNNKK